MAGTSVQTVYHAAAYKHVPMVETNILQGLRNNVFGTLAWRARRTSCGVETCVLISTDKAVRPTNVMGASKRVAELIFQAAAHARGADRVLDGALRQRARLVGLGRAAVPQQIQAGGPITITHPDIIRYFMLIPEAAQLVIQAGAMAQWRRGLRARHGRAGAHRRPGALDDPPVRPDRANDRATRTATSRSRSSACAPARSCSRNC